MQKQPDIIQTTSSSRDIIQLAYDPFRVLESIPIAKNGTVNFHAVHDQLIIIMRKVGTLHSFYPIHSNFASQLLLTMFTVFLMIQGYKDRGTYHLVDSQVAGLFRNRETFIVEISRSTLARVTRTKTRKRRYARPYWIRLSTLLTNDFEDILVQLE